MKFIPSMPIHIWYLECFLQEKMCQNAYSELLIGKQCQHSLMLQIMRRKIILSKKSMISQPMMPLEKLWFYMNHWVNWEYKSLLLQTFNMHVTTLTVVLRIWTLRGKNLFLTKDKMLSFWSKVLCISRWAILVEGYGFLPCRNTS